MQKRLKRIDREAKTIKSMIKLYCHAHHHPKERICAKCDALAQYALSRLQRCPFEGDKPVCSKCAIHCYQTEKRQIIRSVMRYSGPRMLRKHPYLAMMHMIDRLRKAPTLKMKNRTMKMQHPQKNVSHSEAA